MLRRLGEGAARLFEEAVPSLALLIMLVVVLYQVFMRYVLNRPPIWSDELARYLYIWMVFLGAALVSRRRAHVGMEYLPDRLPPRARRTLLLLHEGAIVVFLVAALISGLGFYDFYHRIPSPAMQLPSGYLVGILPVACVLMLVHHVGRIATLLQPERAP